MKITKSELKEMIRECLREELEEGIFGNKYKGKTILVYRGNGKEEAIAIGDTKADNYNLINFQKAHAKKNNNDESDYVNVAATDMAVKKYKQALKSIPDVTSNLPGWVNQYVKDAKAQRAQEFDRKERQKEIEAQAKRNAAKKNNTAKDSDDEYTYVKGNGYGTYRYNTREGLEEQPADEGIFENLF